MFCPQCKSEYRTGFTHCADCDVDLVESLAETPGDSDVVVSDESLQDLWKGEDESVCVDICKELRAAGIPFHVVQRSWEFVKGADPAFQIRVPQGSYSEAKEMLDKAGFDLTYDAEEPSDTELPAEDDAAALETEDGDWDPENWHPEDATVEVWSEKDQENTGLVALALRENQIHTRTDSLDDGSQKIFVLQSDEGRAREIVDEIKDGRPMS
jgi:hypothetical protein